MRSKIEEETRERTLPRTGAETATVGLRRRAGRATETVEAEAVKLAISLYLSFLLTTTTQPLIVLLVLAF